MQLVFGEQFTDRNTGHRCVPRQRNHFVAMTAEDDTVNVADADAQFHRQERLVTRRIERTRLPDDAVRREAAFVQRDVAHGVERIRDDDQNGIGRILRHFARYFADDLLIRAYQIVTAGELPGDRVFLANAAVTVTTTSA